MPIASGSHWSRSSDQLLLDLGVRLAAISLQTDRSSMPSTNGRKESLTQSAEAVAKKAEAAKGVRRRLQQKNERLLLLSVRRF